MIVGGLEGDYFKGPLKGSLSPPVERGVKLHRAIDAYTDAHPVIGQLRRDLPPELRRYAGILIDLSFDHFLSRNWSHYSDLPLPEFSAGVYTVLELSAAARGMAARLVEHDILNLYLEWETVAASARRIGQRFRRHNPFLDIDRELAPKKALIERAFLNFYPDLQSFCEAWNEPL
jgi:acyl carrier protein phosphodiesterase